MAKTAPPRSVKPSSVRLRVGERLRAESTTFYLVLGSTALLIGFGLIMVMDASSVTSHLSGEGFSGRFFKQMLFAAIGLPVMFMISRFPLSFWKKWGRLILIFAAAFQLLVFIPGLGVESGGNTNWIQLFGFNMQPSEFIKIALAIFLGLALPQSIKRYGNSIKSLSPLLATAGVILLVLFGGDLGTIFIFFLISFGAILFAGMNFKNLMVPVIVGAIGVAMMAVISPNRVMRIMSFYTSACTSDASPLCWQPIHGTWAMASGGLFGVGFGNSKMKWSWLPAADNDYIFAIIGEELGLLGCLVLIALFVVLAVALLRVIKEATDPMIRIATGGILFWFVGQAFINIAVVLGLVPVLGLPIPFVSSGGTALVSSMIATGVVLSFARHNSRTAPTR